MTEGEIARLSSARAWGNHRIRVRLDQVRFPDGVQAEWTIVEKNDFACVVPVEEGGFWLVEQYRYPHGYRLWEFPMGAWPPGKTGTQQELAAQELREETGFVADSLEHLGRLCCNPAWSVEHFDVYLASGLTPGERQLEHSEQGLESAWFSDAELRQMVRDGRFRDSDSLAALALYYARA